MRSMGEASETRMDLQVYFDKQNPVSAAYNAALVLFLGKIIETFIDVNDDGVDYFFSDHFLFMKDLGMKAGIADYNTNDCPEEGCLIKEVEGSITYIISKLDKNNFVYMVGKLNGLKANTTYISNMKFKSHLQIPYMEELKTFDNLTDKLDKYYIHADFTSTLPEVLVDDLGNVTLNVNKGATMESNGTNIKFLDATPHPVDSYYSSQYSHLNNLEVTSNENGEIWILLGMYPGINFDSKDYPEIEENKIEQYFIDLSLSLLNKEKSTLLDINDGSIQASIGSSMTFDDENLTIRLSNVVDIRCPKILEDYCFDNGNAEVDIYIEDKIKNTIESYTLNTDDLRTIEIPQGYKISLNEVTPYPTTDLWTNRAQDKLAHLIIEKTK